MITLLTTSQYSSQRPSSWGFLETLLQGMGRLAPTWRSSGSEPQIVLVSTHRALGNVPMAVTSIISLRISNYMVTMQFLSMSVSDTS